MQLVLCKLLARAAFIITKVYVTSMRGNCARSVIVNVDISIIFIHHNKYGSN